MGALAIICLPVRLLFYLVLMILLFPLMLTVGYLRAIFQRVVRGKPSAILRTGSSQKEHGRNKGSPEKGVYAAQLVVLRPFDKDKFEQVFYDLTDEAGIPRKRAFVDWCEEVPNPEIKFGTVEADHYVEKGTNMLQVAFKQKYTLQLRMFQGAPGDPTVIQLHLPGKSWDGSSCFNFMKELLSRYYTGKKCDVFMAGRTQLKEESAKAFDSISFCGFLCRLPYSVLLNASGLVWGLVTMGCCCGGPGCVVPQTTFINLDEEQSAKLAAALKERGAKPFAGLTMAAVSGYHRVFGRYPSNIVQQASLQDRHFLPAAGKERHLIGDWLVGPTQKVRSGYTLADAQRGYQDLLADMNGPSGSVLRAFAAKAYNLENRGAAAFQVLPTYNEPIRLFSSCIFFNNYGVRSMVPEAEVVYWNWGAPFDLGCNCICVNGKTTITFASMIHRMEDLRAVRNHALQVLTEIMDGLAPLKADQIK